MNEQITIAATRIGATATYGGSALTAGSAYAAQQTAAVGTLETIGISVGILTALGGLLLQAYFGWQKLKLQKQAYERLGSKADEADSQKGEL
jgi:hypothetical protein